MVRNVNSLLQILMQVVHTCSLYNDCLCCVDDKHVWLANMTFESNVKVKYTQNQAVAIAMQTPLTFSMMDIRILHYKNLSGV